ncbi:MAG: energy transducer TonB [Pedosphaera sp.]|nr:energy transducer TonB [Pedosphaera sp.]
MDFPTATANAGSFTEASDLSKLCLPLEYQDANRRLAWINSICVLFLAIGFVGLKPPQVHVRLLSEVTEIIPIVITPPDDTPPPPKTEQPPDPEPQDLTTETPVVAVVVAADPAAAAFAVPVEGPVILAPARYAAPPPKNLSPPNLKPTALNSSEEDWGGASGKIEYPALALRNRYQGTVSMEITFDASGGLMSVNVTKSSGYSILDNAAVEKIKSGLRLRVAPGQIKVVTKDYVFRLP